MDFLNLFNSSFLATKPELFLFISINILLLVGVLLHKKLSISPTQYTYNITVVSTIVLAFTGFLLVSSDAVTLSAYNNLLLIDNFTTFIKGVVLLSSIICLLLSLDYITKERIESFEYPILILLSVLGMLLLVSSNDFLAIYLAIELQSLSFYILASFKKHSPYSTEAGLKYFILGAIASGLLLFGFSLVYGFTGITNLTDLTMFFSGTELSEVSKGVQVGILFIVSAFLFKLAAAPFHAWAPDVYQGTPTVITAFFAIVPKIAIVGLLARILYGSFYDLVAYWQQIIVIIAIISMVVGALGALAQTNIKRFIAYSAIGHIGYALMGLAVGSTEGMVALLRYMLIYIVMSVGVFSLILSLRSPDNSKKITKISELSNIARDNPFLAVTFTVLLFSMAGIPPLAGFFSKMYVVLGAVQSQMYSLALVAVVTSVVGAVYYIRIIKIMFFEKTETPFQIEATNPINKTFIVLSCIFVIGFFIFPVSFLDMTQAAACSLFN